MPKLKKDERRIKIVGEKLLVSRDMVEEYDVFEYIESVRRLKNDKINLQNEIKKDITAVIKEIKGNKKKQLIEVKSLLKDLVTVEKEAEEIRKKTIEKEAEEIRKKTIERAKKNGKN